MRNNFPSKWHLELEWKLNFALNVYRFWKESFGQPTLEEEIKKAFKQYDTNGDGFITKEELLSIISIEDAEKSLNNIDIDGDGKISYLEFKLKFWNFYFRLNFFFADDFFLPENELLRFLLLGCCSLKKLSPKLVNSSPKDPMVEICRLLCLSFLVKGNRV